MPFFDGIDCDSNYFSKSQTKFKGKENYLTILEQYTPPTASAAAPSTKQETGSITDPVTTKKAKGETSVLKIGTLICFVFGTIIILISIINFILVFIKGRTAFTSESLKKSESMKKSKAK